MSSDNKWQLDKHVPLAFLTALVIQTGVWIWWAASFSTATDLRIHILEARVAAFDVMPERMAAVEVQLKITNDLLTDIRAQLREQQNARH